MLEDAGRAGPGEVALLHAATGQRFGQRQREFGVDEVLVVAEVDVAGGERRDLVGDIVGRARQVLAAAERRNDAEGALHPAAPRGADHRDRRIDRGPVGSVLADPDGVVAPRIPEVAPGPRERRRVGVERPSGTLARARDRDLRDPVEGLARRGALDDRPEGSTPLAAHDGVERRRVVVQEVLGGDRRVVAADDQAHRRERGAGGERQALRVGGLVRVGGEADQVGPEAGQRAAEGQPGETGQAQVEDPDLVAGRDGGGDVAELERLEQLEALERPDRGEARAGLDEQDAHRGDCRRFGSAGHSFSSTVSRASSSARTIAVAPQTFSPSTS